jgi:hypothetical protein
VRQLREELQLLQEPGSYVGEVIKVGRAAVFLGRRFVIGCVWLVACVCAVVCGVAGATCVAFCARIKGV